MSSVANEKLILALPKGRILQEAALLVDRSDIQEEIVRLENHAEHFLGLLDAGGEIGKKLDFLLQEMNREANTLASKAASQEISDCALELKLLVEQMREQVQNIE